MERVPVPVGIDADVTGCGEGPSIYNLVRVFD
jgi:hypothetical protein